jgi:hypothetical protein
MRLHAVRDNFYDRHVYGARLPSARRVGRGFEGDALCVIAIFDIEGTRFADDEGEPARVESKIRLSPLSSQAPANEPPPLETCQGFTNR